MVIEGFPGGVWSIPKSLESNADLIVNSVKFDPWSFGKKRRLASIANRICGIEPIKEDRTKSFSLGGWMWNRQSMTIGWIPLKLLFFGWLEHRYSFPDNPRSNASNKLSCQTFNKPYTPPFSRVSVQTVLDKVPLRSFKYAHNKSSFSFRDGSKTITIICGDIIH